jgi:hypothetical protein
MLIELLIDDDSLDPVRTGSFFILKNLLHAEGQAAATENFLQYSVRNIIIFCETIYLVLERLESPLA